MASAATPHTAPWPRVLVLTLAVALCYANSLHVPFLLDDPRPGTALEHPTRHLVWASFGLNRALSGAATWSYHVFNALVHLACGLLLYGVLRRSLALAAPGLAARTRDGLAFATALLWLCHPLETAAVTYLSQRAEALAACFYLALLYAFLRSLSSSRPWAWQALALAALGLGFASKETIATAPIVVWLLDALFLAGGVRAALRVRRRFHVLLALLTLGLASALVVPTLFGTRVTAGLRFEEFGPLEYARTQPGVILHYLRLSFWPHPLVFDPGWPIAATTAEWLPQSAAVAALLAGTLLLCRRRSWIGFAGACFFLALAPSSSFVPILDPAFEHRMYLALAPVLALVVVAAWWLGTRLRARGARVVLPLLAGAASLALAALTIRRNQDYGSEVGLWQLTVLQAPRHARAHANLASALLDAGRPQEAIPELFEALALDTRDGTVSLSVSPVAYLKLGNAYTALEQPERALPFYRRAVELCAWPDSLAALGDALLRQGDDAGAALQLETLLALDPDDAALRTRLAEVLARLGRTEEALAHAQAAFALEPNTAGEAFGLGQLLGTLGRYDEAMAAFREAMRLAPELPAPRAAFARAVCLKSAATPAERQEALQLAAQAIEMTGSTHAGFLEVGALAYAALGEHARALALIETALALPDAAADAQLTDRLRALREDHRRRLAR